MLLPVCNQFLGRLGGQEKNEDRRGETAADSGCDDEHEYLLELLSENV